LADVFDEDLIRQKRKLNDQMMANMIEFEDYMDTAKDLNKEFKKKRII
jgi:hypothetical protein|tara:strand:+ start:18118 stop:18261 length:144 start_codon:yes stop_codon:yes gene_type:complete